MSNRLRPFPRRARAAAENPPTLQKRCRRTGGTIKVRPLPENVCRTQIAVLGNRFADGFTFVHGNATLVTTLKARFNSGRTTAQFEVLALENTPGSRTVKIPQVEQPSFVPYPSVHTTVSGDGKWLGARFQRDSNFVIWGVDEGGMSNPRRITARGNFWELRLSPSGRMLWTENGAIDVASEQRISKLLAEAGAEMRVRIRGTTSKNTSPLRRSLGFQERIDHCEHSVFLSMIEILA